jgi:DNA invertase Pin-like site-specific DNA recombinase
MMMDTLAHQKVTTRHLKRSAYLYIRQSTLRQVFENTESTERQYGLRQRAVALGWQQDQVVVIDSDQGQSGASMAGRDGFQRLVADVGLGRAGIVMGLEVSRLARNSSDWHRLLEICALTDTLILDEDGIYDPGHFNDRLLLGLKGTMSEAELHILRARLRGGVLSKARRGELESPLPIGFCYDASNRVVLDPDKQVQQSLHTFFNTFRRVGSATATVRGFRDQGLMFPRRARSGPAKGEILWGELEHSRALWLLHNPRYAGAFFFGRTRQRQAAPQRFKRLAREEWIALIPNAHAGYISWDDFESNQRRLSQNAQAQGTERRKSPPREGPALLQGVVVCGRCGERMTVRYEQQSRLRAPIYVCQRDGIRQAKPICQSVPGTAVDMAIGRLLVSAVSPMALEVALTIQGELQMRSEEADRLRCKQLERVRYEADLARRRYMQVDPGNRLVADELEAEWNRKLRDLEQAQQTYEDQSKSETAVITPEQRASVLALATDFPKLWDSPHTSDRERKRMLRLLIEDVTLIKGNDVVVHVRFRGGTTQTLSLSKPAPAWQLRQTPAQIVAEIDQLLNAHSEREVADVLNKRGLRAGNGGKFTGRIVDYIRRTYKLPNRYARLRARGLLTQKEMARKLRVLPLTIRVWRRQGLLRGHPYTERNDYLYEPPGPDAPVKGKWKFRRGKKASSLSHDE